MAVYFLIGGPSPHNGEVPSNSSSGDIIAAVETLNLRLDLREKSFFEIHRPCRISRKSLLPLLLSLDQLQNLWQQFMFLRQPGRYLAHGINNGAQVNIP